MKTKFTRDELVELGLPGDEVYSTSVVYSTIVARRQCITYEIVFKYKDKFWRTWYSKGPLASDGPWEHEDLVECEEVKAVGNVIEWVAKED
jgi:hypothetical protein